MPVWLVTWFFGGGWKYAAGVAAVAILALLYGIWHHHVYQAGVDWERGQEATKIALAVDQARKMEKAGQVIVSQAAKTVSANVEKIHESVRTVKEYVYVQPPAADCRVPAYVIRLYNASGTGTDPTTPGDGSGSDGIASDLPCDQVVQAIADNNEAFRANAEQLMGLQKAYTDLRTKYNTNNSVK